MDGESFYVHTDFDKRKSIMHKGDCKIFQMRKEQRRISIDLEGNHRIVREWHGPYLTFDEAVSKSSRKEKRVIINPESAPDFVEEVTLNHVSPCVFCQSTRRK